MASTPMQRSDSACTVRLKPVEAGLTPNRVMKEAVSIYMTSRPVGASASFEDSGVHAVYLYFQTAEEANSSKHYLDNRQFLGRIVRWSLLDGSDGCKIRLSPIEPARSKDEVMQEARKRLAPSFQPRDASSAFKDPWKSDGFVADLYYETPQKAKSALVFLQNRTFFYQVVAARVVGARPTGLQQGSGSSPSRAPVVNPAVDPVQSQLHRLDVSDGCKIRLSPIGPTRSNVEVMQEARKRLVPIFQPRDASSAFKDPWKSDGFVADLYYETPQKAKSALNFLHNREFFDQVVAARVVGAQPIRLQQGSGSSPSRAPVVNSAVVVVVEPVQLPSDQLQSEVRRALKALDVQHASENLFLEHGFRECDDASRLHPHLSPCVYLHFKDRDTANNAAECLSRAGVLQDRQVRGLMKEDLDHKGSPEDYISHCSHSGRNLRPCDEAAYTQSGVLLHRHKERWGEVEALLCRTPSGYAFLQGTRLGGEDSKRTALRILKEQTGLQIEDKKIAGMEVLWFGKEAGGHEAERALYLIDVSQIANLPSGGEFTRGGKTFVWLSLSHLGEDFQSFPQYQYLPQYLSQDLPPKLINWATEYVSRQSTLFNFNRFIRKELQGAEAEKPKILTLIRRFSIPVPKFQAKLPTDLVPLPREHKVFKELEEIWRRHDLLVDYPIKQIKKVIVPDRMARFESYVKSLGSDGTESLRLLHGTPSTKAANSIARNGPNISLAGQQSGRKLLGSGFYTAATPVESVTEYAKKSGAVCVCKGAPGRMEHDGHEGLDSKTMSAMGKHSAVYGEFHVFFHPDAIVVEYIIDHGDDDTITLQQMEAENEAVRKHKMAETERIQKKEEQLLHQEMVDYFYKQCCEMITRVEKQPKDLPLWERLFRRETQQFHQKLPIYAKKEDILRSLEENNGLVLKGGTGIGKSVLVPQWVYDHCFCTKGYSHWKVAVLVPRRAIAESLATYVSRVRGGELGGEIGLGIDGNVKMTGESRIVFMTYGFFRAISMNNKDFDKWGAVILDEAHERKTDADSILLRLGSACRAREKFKAIVMSATIEGSKFVDILRTGGMPKTCPMIEVKGVAYPVEVIWWDGEPWTPRQDKALVSLARETIRIYNYEPTGNILVFLSTVGEVEEMARELGELLKHDAKAKVCSLYAAMSDGRKRAVTNFDSSNGERLICISTNIAEAGITIAGISVVIETGWEMEVAYDPVTMLTTSQQMRISKASQIQRRGRAGRTRPGTCHCMYSKEEFDTFSEYSMPEMLKSNLEQFTLGMMAAGFDPFTMDILDRDKVEDRLECAKQHLLKFDAIEKGKSGNFQITGKGNMLARLPMELNLGLSIVAASDRMRLHCSASVAIVACMFQMASKGLFDDRKPGKNRYKHRSGDHMTYLDVFEAWAQQGKSETWCDDNGISFSLLTAADALLVKVHAGMTAAKIPIIDPPPGSDRTVIVLRSICAGLCHQTAVPFNTTTTKDGFLLTQDYDKNPTLADLHRMSSLSKSDAPASQLVVFQSRTQSKDGKDLLFGVSAVERKWVEEAMAHDVTGLQAFKEILTKMERKSESISISYKQDAPTPELRSGQKTQQIAAFVNNYKELKTGFPTVCFKYDASSPDKLMVSFPVELKQKVVAKVEGCVAAVQPESGQIDVSTVSLEREVDLLLQNFRKDVKKHLGSFCTVEPVGAARYKITTFKACNEAVLDIARSRLGLPSINAWKPILGGFETERLRALQCGTKDGILHQFGRGKLGSLLLLARVILRDTKLWIYGGFIRDVLFHGNAHDELDLDVGIPLPPSTDTPQQWMMTLTTLADQNGMSFRRSRNAGDKLAVSFFRSIDDSTDMEVQVVDSHAFAVANPDIDFDVNNLKLGPGADANTNYELKVAVPGMTVEKVAANIRSKQLVVHKKASLVIERINKMRKREWRISYLNMLPGLS